VRVIHGLPRRRLRRPLSLAIGVFDGVHVGHQAIINAAFELGRPHALLPSVLTFDPHPGSVLRPGGGPPLLTTIEERLKLLASLGVHTAIVARFDRELAGLPPEDFVRDILIGKLRARCLTIGRDWRFGAKASGDASLLAELGPRYGFVFCSCPSVTVDGVIVSSTLLRSLLAGGEVTEAVRYLGRPYQLSNTVQAGEQRGRRLGIRTANLALPPGKVVPADGVYACWAGVSRFAPAVASVGVRPTFTEEGERRIEVHLLDRPRPPRLLGRRLRVAFAVRLRGERRFPSAEALQRQMGVDARSARSLLAALQPPTVVL
jgi:riboflavin kinase/FMN adenylyltransferase